MTYDSVYQMLLQDIRSKAHAAQQNEARFMQLLEQESRHLAGRKSAVLLKDERQARQRALKIDQIVMALYEDRASGLLPAEQFQAMFVKLDAEKKELQAKLDAVDAMQHQQEKQADRLTPDFH